MVKIYAVTQKKIFAYRYRQNSYEAIFGVKQLNVL